MGWNSNNYGALKHGGVLGGKATREYTSWQSMKARCYRKSLPVYALYGGRGIAVCARWRGENGFANFLSDMGPRPLRTSLERIDNDKGYSPENCRWATQSEQMSNTKRTVVIDIGNFTGTMTEWCEALKLDHRMVSKRLKRGYAPVEALFAPKRRGYRSDLKAIGGES